MENQQTTDAAAMARVPPPPTGSGMVTLPRADVEAVLRAVCELARYVEATDQSATGSRDGIEYIDKACARLWTLLPNTN